MLTSLEFELIIEIFFEQLACWFTILQCISLVKLENVPKIIVAWFHFAKTIGFKPGEVGTGRWTKPWQQ